MKIVEVNCETGVETIREATLDEKNDAKLRKEKYEIEQQQEEANLKARAKVIAKLAVLGLEEDDLKALGL